MTDWNSRFFFYHLTSFAILFLDRLMKFVIFFFHNFLTKFAFLKWPTDKIHDFFCDQLKKFSIFFFTICQRFTVFLHKQMTKFAIYFCNFLTKFMIVFLDHLLKLWIFYHNCFTKLVFLTWPIDEIPNFFSTIIC